MVTGMIHGSRFARGFPPARSHQNDTIMIFRLTGLFQFLRPRGNEVQFVHLTGHPEFSSRVLGRASSVPHTRKAASF